MNRKTFLQKLGLIAGAAIAAPVIAKEVVEASESRIKMGCVSDGWNYQTPAKPKPWVDTGKVYIDMHDYAPNKDWKKTLELLNKQGIIFRNARFETTDPCTEMFLKQHPQRGNLFDV